GGSGGQSGLGGPGGSTGAAGHGAGGASAPTGIAGTTGGSVTGSAGTGGTPPGMVLYTDNFESDTVGTMASGWIQGDTDTGLGTWAVAGDGSNVLQGAASGSDFTVDVGGNVAWTDYSFQVDVKMISGSSWEVGVYGRFAVGTDKANFYEAYMDDSGSVQLRVKQNGSTTTLGTKSKATSAPTLDTTYTFKLDMHGSSITISVNGMVRVMVTDTTLTAGGIGVIVEGGTAEFDNVVVTE
ncbi:MAG TPA: family 16 glycoside hydrolase, partial [Polyangia bacterium]|nr:family 16 glycoside hydrolase [Polyangia bacterium]